MIPPPLQRRLLLAGLVAGLAILGFLLSSPAPRAAVAVAGAWATFGAPESHQGFTYMTLTLNPGRDDMLLGAETPIAASVDMLAPIGPPPQAQLMTILNLPIHGGQPLVLQPRGAHLILRGLSSRPAVGQSFPLTLHFQQAGAVAVTVTVYVAPPDQGMPKLPKSLKLS